MRVQSLQYVETTDITQSADVEDMFHEWSFADGVPFISLLVIEERLMGLYDVTQEFAEELANVRWALELGARAMAY